MGIDYRIGNDEAHAAARRGDRGARESFVESATSWIRAVAITPDVPPARDRHLVLDVQNR
eukprot:m.399108 g.399108  ORF g.399108 m.399108 type:complete len:60 (-) comp21144_c0_seq16:147-326(-)